jgi:membrane protein DedA with SNARE-associated domain
MLENIASWIINIISTLGYPGIILTMAIESALIPLPSEIIMPFSGFLTTTGRFDLWLVALSGAVGNVIGSLVAYAIGYYGHEKLVRRFVRKWGKFILITEDELDYTEKLLNKYQDLVVLGSRVLPGIRTVISLPCGFAKLPLGRFIVMTFIGSFIWSLILAYIGVVLGQNWHSIGPIFHKFDAAILIAIGITAGWYIYYKLKKH